MIKAQAMKLAHWLRRKQANEFHRELFGECLRQAWKVEKGEQTLQAAELIIRFRATERRKASRQSLQPAKTLFVNVNAIGSRAPKAKPRIFLSKRGTSHANFWGFGW